MNKEKLIEEAKEYIDIFAHTYCNCCEVCSDDNEYCMLRKLIFNRVDIFGNSVLRPTYELFISKQEYDNLSKDELRDTMILSKEFGFDIVFSEKKDTERLLRFLNKLQEMI